MPKCWFPMFLRRGLLQKLSAKMNKCDLHILHDLLTAEIATHKCQSCCAALPPSSMGRVPLMRVSGGMDLGSPLRICAACGTGGSALP